MPPELPSPTQPAGTSQMKVGFWAVIVALVSVGVYVLNVNTSHLQSAIATQGKQVGQAIEDLSEQTKAEDRELTEHIIEANEKFYQVQRSIDLTLGEVRQMRMKQDDHYASDEILSERDVRDAVRDP